MMVRRAIGRIALEGRDLFELLLLPGLAAVLPWPLCFRLFRWVSRFEGLYRERWQPALQRASAAGRVADARIWARHARLVALVDHADLYLVMTRSDRRYRRHVTRSGVWPPAGKPFIGYTFHWAAGFWALRDLASHGLRAHPLVASLPSADVRGPFFRTRYARLRNRFLERTVGAAPLDVGRDLRGVIRALRDGDGVIAAVDVPPGDAAAERIPFLDGSIRVPRAMFRLATERALPAVVFLCELDLRTGRRHVEVQPLAATEDAAVLAHEAFGHLSRRVATEPEAWHFWGSFEHFDPRPADSCAAPVVDVVVPVYADLARTQRCIESVLAAHGGVPYALVVVVDAPPDGELLAWCRTLEGRQRVELLFNESNRGFVASVNRAMALHPERDVVLLNSDCEVADGWLDRLLACADRHADAGTLTPFSNDATICSYPAPAQEDDPLSTLGVGGLDALFARENAGLSVELPVGVGSCMFIRRACLDQTGAFDEAAFGRGYGEECDFCLRAAQHGWRHLLCADVFVFHAGGASFGDEKPALVESAQRVLRERWPDYDQQIGDFVRRDPIRPLRDTITRAARNKDAPRAP